MFDVGFSELILLAIVALVVLGPEKLPHAARIAGGWVGRIRRTVSTMQAEIEREVAAQEIRGKLENEFQEIGGSDLVQELRRERQQIAAGLQEASHDIETSLTDEPAADVVAPQAPSLLADAAKPLDAVEMDGEKAYRDWLEAQRQNRPAPSTSSDDQSAS
jgi:sec-independent protein translocase protein TatB